MASTLLLTLLLFVFVYFAAGSNQRPSITALNNITELEGRQVEINCHSRGDPLPRLVFIKGNHAPYRRGDNADGVFLDYHDQGRTLKLTIRNLNPSHAGTYTCRARNSIGRDEANSTVVVEFAPRFPVTLAVEVYAWAGSVRNITCITSGVPTPDIYWMINNFFLRNNNTFYIFNEDSISRLQVRVRRTDQTWIYATYTCRAINKHGQRSVDIALRRATVPGIPVYVNVTQRLPTMLILYPEQPTDDGGMPVIGYRIQYDENLYDFDTTSDGLIRIENLEPNTSYTLSVSAKNQVGVGQPMELTISTQALEPARITELRHNVNALNNSALSLICRVSGVPAPRIGWSHNGRTIGPDEFRHMILNITGGSLLRIGGLRASQDSGIVECTASNGVSEPVTAQTRIRVYGEDNGYTLPAGFPRIVRGPSYQQVERGQSTIIPCSATGNPQPTFTWYKNYVPLNMSDTRLQVLPTGSLQITFTQRSDAGIYECLAENSVGLVASGSADLVVRFVLTFNKKKAALSQVKRDAAEPVRITEARHNVNVLNNSALSLVCRASGVPAPRIGWSRNGRPINSDEHRYTIVYIAGGSVLRIRGVRAPQDDGYVKCTASNGVSEPVTAQTSIQVYSADNVPAGFPRIVDDPRSRAAAAITGQPTIMTCSATGNPQPTVTWYKNLVPLNTSDTRLQVLRNGSLLITSTQRSDSGRYECFAENSLGLAVSDDTSLFVRKVRRQRRRPPHITMFPEDITVMPGASFNLTCEAVGYPTPNVSWLQRHVYDGAISIDVPIGSGGQLRRNVLTLTNLRHSAIYTCLAQSSLGFTERDVNITVTERPHFTVVPKDVTVRHGAAVNLTCEAAGRPTPNVSWRLRPSNVAVPGGSEGQPGRNVLTLTDIRSSANFTCVAQSRIGLTEHNVTVTVMRRPTPGPDDDDYYYYYYDDYTGDSGGVIMR